jgi:hypothetical protein
MAGQVRAKGEARRTRSDFMKMEQDRGISVSASAMSFDFSSYCSSRGESFLRFHQLGLQKHRIECAASHVRDLPVFRESDSMRLWPRSFCSLRSLEQL